MAQRIEIAPSAELDDVRGRFATKQARDHLQLQLERVRSRTVYKLSFDLPPEQLERVREALTDPILEESSAERLPLPSCHWVIAVGFRPGVTDAVGQTARIFVSDVLGRRLSQNEQVFTETLYFVDAPTLSRGRVEQLAVELLANAIVERTRIWTAGEYAESPPDLELPLAGSDAAPLAETVPLPASAGALLELSRSRTLSLTLEELGAIRQHYLADGVGRRRRELGLPPDPTDVELEAIAQTWSEHCKHKIFRARIRHREADGAEQVVDSLFRTYIVEATRDIGRRVDWLVSVFDDNAGVVRVADDLNLVYKVETHNSPSALDPYGGAMTGIVGVNRDPLGTGLGAALLTNVWGYCLAAPDGEAQLPEGLLHPRRIRDGVHRGVIDGGNQSGLPYSRGFEFFDARFLGKPLVFCGTVGVLPTRVGERPGHCKEVCPGDVVVMVGGRVGKDGIHGATFSSEALHAASPSQAVQIGDPFTQKTMADMLLEARDLGLYRAITDNGAGGLSSSVGELAQLCGGAELQLDAVPLKYQGMHPWEILLSEAQERMTLAVPPDRLEALLSLARRREVEATPIGRFTDGGSFRLRYGDRVVGDLDLTFLHQGCPVMELEAEWSAPRHHEPEDVGIDLAALDAGEVLTELMGRLNLCCRASQCRRYDHEVKGLSVIKPLVGVRGDVPADATVMRVAHGRQEAILLAEGLAPRLSDLDPASMAAYAVDLAARRIIAGGGRLGQIAGLDNFCWPDPVPSESNPDGRRKLGALVLACRALSEMTRGLDLPCISGKDSMKNDSIRGGVRISIPPTLLFSALGWIDDAGAALDLVPTVGDRVYLLGTTQDVLGGSELYAMLAEARGEPDLIGRRAPVVDAATCLSVCGAAQRAASAGLLSAAHAPHLGGLGAALATMCLAAEHGLELSLDAVPGASDLSPVQMLFSESASRLILATPARSAGRLEELLVAEGVPWGCLGEVVPAPLLRVTSGRAPVLEVSIADLRRTWERRDREVHDA